ncbi:Stage II sporulation protein E (SpoIIE) [Nonomuraea coxensis DSM 45129]|uniref:Stage II sporulation protein E (SpoIIE) n=1 Tax=Nonomuraea coxensis DSM 45129 TaxID=1122611 RepID=A0ABX8U509_9ACTN|nr:SpoIIE family protein phosphatase [Nonomuraea coxensis]QYC42506.1 Stage II sporulation protein E (SpoIIE) [Nonomuraea coxensis DSM 45129]
MSGAAPRAIQAEDGRLAGHPAEDGQAEDERVESGRAERGRAWRLPELVDAGAYIVDDHGLIVEVNAQAERLVGRRAADLLGRDAHELLHRDSRGESIPGIRCMVKQAFLSGRTLRSELAWFERGDGSLTPAAWTVAPCELAPGRRGALVLFHQVDPAVLPGPWAADAEGPLSELDRLALLAETTTTLTSTLDVEEILRQLVRLVVPLLADWAVVDLLTEEGGVSRQLVVHHENGVLVHHEDLEGGMPPVPEASSMPLSRALRGVTAALAGPETYRGRPDSALAVVQQELFRATGMHSASIAPIRGVRETLGALTLGRSGRHDAFTQGELLLAEDIARRAGLALDNARLYERQRRVAETMQRHLLPRLPVVPGVRMSARYVPAPGASQVGGDWYDAFPLPSGATALVIGDVVGHDLDAAAGMAQICNMLRAYAGDQDEPPHAIVDRLDQAVTRMVQPVMATMVLARMEPAPSGHWTLRWSNAGHPPPLLVERDGRARYLEEGHGLLLGTGMRASRPDAAVELPPGSTLLFYTDGLIESPSRILDEGLGKLAACAAALAERPLDSFCDLLLSGVRPDDNDDDVAMLVLRLPG